MNTELVASSRKLENTWARTDIFRWFQSMFHICCHRPIAHSWQLHRSINGQADFKVGEREEELKSKMSAGVGEARDVLKLPGSTSELFFEK